MLQKKYFWMNLVCFYFLFTLSFEIKAVFSDEIKMIDGNILEGEIGKVNEEAFSFRKEDGSEIDIQLKDVNFISKGNEIIIVNHSKEGLSILRLPKPENISIKNIDYTTTDTLILPGTEIESTEVADEETEQILEFTDDGQPSDTDKKVQSTSEQPSSVSAEEVVQTEEKEVIPPQRTWKGNVDAGMNIKDGNTESATTHIKGSYANIRSLDNIFFDALILYETVTDKATDEDVETANEQRATGKYEYKHTLRLYSFFNQYFEHDEIERLSYRSISSPGVGYRFIDKEHLKYKAEAGPAYTYERFHGGITDEYLGIRIGQYLDWRILDTITFYAKAEYVQSAENTSDWRVDSGLGVRHNLTKSIALSLELLDQYDNTPAEGAEKEDRTLIGSVGYSF
ncbi:MAG: DUF481 domain-containing protein [Candidatus Jettenia sp.]|uniref:DUF481 domain-containing protein n=1 Tax=Candidatus Jettenia caeni TaxID=247490 RepID=I3IMS1_9BACT|nr:DUF481 domain-containing protein [Candidatus Jettenia sp. AMX1]MBC6928724.1 DUF481 domain-containing protein [Candidatus Jettenia sp.]NUN22235.1 DUF481 domain-containing protein [Candidatus Jettenia caeni]KAA0250697.1 MAG: DUF481 domain-containing protein [Candidatus Jettenia sp. AMX1]MCE7880036.1 DUF481 domain-containing protein [Candidatus Jettenia sp. AMX1]MCQ3926818.1 DUF481 domain-containing protein [Candidatus Jettenia sp.]